MSKDEVRLELAFDLMSTVHTNLCNNKKLEQADELRDIMRRLILLSQKIGGKKA